MYKFAVHNATFFEHIFLITNEMKKRSHHLRKNHNASSKTIDLILIFAPDSTTSMTSSNLV